MDCKSINYVRQNILSSDEEKLIKLHSDEGLEQIYSIPYYNFNTD